MNVSECISVSVYIFVFHFVFDFFLEKMVTGNEKWIVTKNQNWRKSCKTVFSIKPKRNLIKRKKIYDIQREFYITNSLNLNTLFWMIYWNKKYLSGAKKLNDVFSAWVWPITSSKWNTANDKARMRNYFICNVFLQTWHFEIIMFHSMQPRHLSGQAKDIEKKLLKNS